MLKRTLIFISILLAVIAGLGMIKYQQIQESMAMMAAGAPPPTSVEVSTAHFAQWAPHIPAVGTLTAHQGIDVSNEVEGIVEKIHIASGQQVNAGDLLVTLNDDVEQANLASFKAQEELAQILFKRSKNMWQKKTISESDYDNAYSLLKVAQANVKQTLAQIAKKSIRAPFSGKLGIRHISTGQYLPTGTMLVSLQDHSTLYADFSISEKYLPHIMVGLETRFQVSAYPEQIFAGQVQAIDAKVNEATRNINVRALLENQDGRLHPGMYADINLVLDQPADRIVVPATAIVFSSFGSALFVVEENEEGNMIAQRIQITTGEHRGDLVAVLSGLKGGEKVVQAGVNKLGNNVPVTITKQKRLRDGQE
ncbi:MAG: efflux RND transporter periplasmic adaptor subunit [Gammaproteobacteria bacterium]|nr:efflux RND transporter periplasmic adaptor subunit [Gammaproteobacteria bacterium]